MQTLTHDLRYTLRRLRNAPGFALLAVLTLAVGIGPTTAVYAVFRQVLLRQLPVFKPQELVLLRQDSAFDTGSFSSWGGGDHLYFTAPSYRALRAAYPQLAAISRQPVNLATAKEAVHGSAQMVSGNYFSLLGERPLLGRLFGDEDDRVHAANPVAVLSEGFWRGHLGGSSAVLNMQIVVNGAPFTIVGVAADRGVMDAEPADLFLPETAQQAVSLGEKDREDDPLFRWLLVMGRIPDGPGRAQTAARLGSAWVDWRRDVLRTNGGSIRDKKGWMRTSLSLAPGSRGVSLLGEQFGTPVKALQAMSVLVLLIACANLAGLLLARAAGQRAQTALQACLGASRLEIAKATVLEALLLGVAGTASGAALGWACLRLLTHLAVVNNSLDGALHAPWHWSVVLFAVAAGLLTSLLFSIGPMLAHLRVDAAEVLHGGQGVLSRAGRTRNALVSGSVALSLVLLLAATLVGWNLYRLSTTPPGFIPDHLLTFSVDESATGATPERTAAVYQQLLASLRPRGSTAAYAQNGILSGNQMGNNISVAGRVNMPDDPAPNNNWVSRDFFRTLGVPILRGREFTDADTAANEPVAIVDQAFVRVFFGGDAARALDGRFGFGAGDHFKYNFRIVGIVPTFHEDSLQSLPGVPYLYLAYPQTFSSGGRNDHAATFYLRTSGDPSALGPEMRALVRRIDPKLPVLDLRTMREQVSASVADTRLLAALSAALGALSVFLAVVGLYGVLAYQVASRTREIGLRIAVGASRERIMGLLFARMLRLTAWGLGTGALLAFAAMRLLRHQASELAPAPPWLYGVAALLLLAATFAASAIPAWRAAHIDPNEALRSE